MAFTFLHSADWQIGKAFGGFDPERASVLKRARLEAIDRLAAAARAAGARDVVVCGDVFDGPGLADRTLRETVARLANHADVVWHLLPGNHDPARADGIWHRIGALQAPSNVMLLLKAVPHTIAEQVVLLPAPLFAKSVNSDPTVWMDSAETAAGAIRIGVAHGSTQGFGSSGTASVGIDPARRQSARLDYLALGDWHGVREVSSGVWYSGTPEPDQFPDNEPGFALAVTIDAAGSEPRVERVATAAHLWMKRIATLRDSSGLASIEAEIAALGPAKSNLLLELTLDGTVSLVADAEIAAILAAVEPQIFHLAVRRESLRLDSGGGDIDALADPQVARVARRLAAMSDESYAGAVAQGALRRLFTLARQVEASRS